jgi:hypothetical protein
VSPTATRVLHVVRRGSQIASAETPRRATSGSAEDTVHAGIATSVLTTSRGAASDSSLKATVRRNSPAYRRDLRNAREPVVSDLGKPMIAFVLRAHARRTSAMATYVRLRGECE